MSHSGRNFPSTGSLIEDKSRILLNNFLYFFFFMLFAIFGTLIFYIQTRIEIVPFIVLSLLWILFWKNSELKGRIFLVTASAFGYVHELIGVHFEYFTYLGGIIGGVPLWILPGYGAIFWSSHNLWKIFEENYSTRHWFEKVNYFFAASFVLLLAADYALFDLSLNPLAIMVKFLLAIMLFNTITGLRLAWFVGFFTVLTEFSGETLGAWAHPDFSFFSLMAGYIFLLWICLTINDLIKKEKKWGRVEAVAAILLSIYYIFSMTGMIVV